MSVQRCASPCYLVALEKCSAPGHCSRIVHVHTVQHGGLLKFSVAHPYDSLTCEFLVGAMIPGSLPTSLFRMEARASLRSYRRNFGRSQTAQVQHALK